jgi:geranylgeranylglycerol-phosphate geranylgeranyltransferase
MTHPKSPSSLPLAYGRMIRPVNCFMMGLAVIVGEVAIAGGLPSLPQAAFGFLVSFLLAGSSMVINDIIDLQIDMVNAPDRPLPSGAVSTGSAKVFAAALTIMGVLSAAALSPYALAVAVATFFISLAYNLYGKKLGLPGNLMVAFCIAVPFLFGGMAVSSILDVNVAVFFLLAFLASVGREITKGMADIEGDRLKGIKTVALANGTWVAAILSAAFYMGAVALTPFPYLTGNLGIYYLAIVLVVDAGFAYSSASILRRQDKPEALKVKRQVRVWMLLALLAFLAGGLTS